MSMILEALSRAEKERQAEHGNDLDASKYVASSTIKEDRFKKWVLIALLANFSLILLFAAGYLWNTYANSVVNSEQSAAAAPSAQQQSNNSEAIDHMTSTVVNSQSIDEPIVKSAIIDASIEIDNKLLKEGASYSNSSLESEAHVNKTKPLVAKPKIAPANTVAKKTPPVQYSAQPLSQPSINKQTNAQVTRHISNTLQANNASLTNYNNITKLNDMPPAQRSQLAQMQVNVHVYDDNPQSRFVLIDMVKYKEGDRMSGANASITSIVPEGVVLDYAGKQVLIERNK